MNPLLLRILLTLIVANALFFAPVLARSRRPSSEPRTLPLLWPYRLFAVLVVAITPILGLMVAGIIAPDSELPFIAITFATFVLMALQARGYDAVDTTQLTHRKQQHPSDRAHR